MTVSIKNLTRQPVNYTLTPECATPALPLTPGVKMKAVYAENMRKAPDYVAEATKFAPTLTLSGRETRTGLPDPVAKAPEIVAAILARQVEVRAELSPVMRRAEPVTAAPSSSSEDGEAVADADANAGNAPKRVRVSRPAETVEETPDRIRADADVEVASPGPAGAGEPAAPAKDAPVGTPASAAGASAGHVETGLPVPRSARGAPRVR